MAYTLADLQAGVRRKMGNRSDQNANINLWLAAAIRELTNDYPFNELQKTAAVTQFVANQSVYSKTFFTDGTDWTRITSWFMFYNGNTGPGSILDGRGLKVVETMASIVGIPKYWALSDDTNLLVGYMPNNSYYTRCRYQQTHPFTAVPANTDPVLMPIAWKEVIEYAGAIRGCSELRAFDYVERYTNLIHGDNLWRSSGGIQGQPGLIFGLTSQTQRNMDNSTRQLKPIVSRY